MFSGLLDLPWWGLVLVTLALTHVTIAAVTIFLHRYQAHRALELHPAVSHFFRFWLWLTTGMVTREWAAIHRKHHAKCETAEDPHSPQVHGLNRILWTGVFFYVRESRIADTMARYGHGTPDDWLERNLYTPRHKLGVALMLLADVALFGVVPGLLIWAVQMAWIPFWAAGVVNGIGHFWGYRNFECADASRNILPWGLVIGGEELHNNHHAFATSAKLSVKWYEFDVGWLYIRSLAALRLVRVKKTIPVPRLGSLRQTVDLDVLQAVMTYRYDLMARYVKSLGRVYAQELARLRAEHGERFDIRALRKHLFADAASLTAQSRVQLAEALALSPKLAQLHRAREDLLALWSRSAATREQLLKQLQDWCHRAEESGIRQLQELSSRIRSYA